MNLRLRFSLLFVALLGALLLALAGVRLLQTNHEGAIALSERMERETLLRELVKLEIEGGQHFADDNSMWDEMVEFVRKPRKAWAEVNIEESLSDSQITCAWVFSPDATPIYSACWLDRDKTLEPPFDGVTLRQLFRQPTFDAFQERNGELFEVHGGAIVASDDFERTKPPAGYLMIAKRWDAAKLRAMEPITQGTLQVADQIDPAGLPPGQAAIPLPAIDGRPVAWLVLRYATPELESIVDHESYELLSVAAIGFTALLLFWWYLEIWVLRPLALIGQSIAKDDDRMLVPLQNKSDEIGRLAQLVGESQDQRLLLREALDERVRLGRDLHDGSIQKIYSFGMNMASARGLLHSDPAAAERILGQSLGVVNEVIGELRAFIQRLEPDPAVHQAMSEVFRKLLEPSGTELRTEVAIDDSLADRLDPRQRNHLMFFASEAISNALRHARATSLRLALQAEGDGARLEVIDDGTGFDVAKVPADRGGQRNLAARARELGATLHIQSAPGQGTAIILHLPREILSAPRNPAG